jgi:hypothetical protein
LARKIRERLIRHGILHRVSEERAETASAHPGYVCRLGENGCKCLKHQCESQVLACPRDIHRFFTTLLTSTARSSCLYDGFKLHRVEVSLSPLWGRVGPSARIAAFRTRYPSSAKFQSDDHTLRFGRKIDRFNQPSLVQAQQNAIVIVEFVYPTTLAIC